MYSSPSRSGRAPPSMEGSVTSELIGKLSSDIGGCMEDLTNAIESCESEEQLRADPAYLAYYCANVNWNLRLPPPLISREGHRLVHHIGGSANNRKMRVFVDDLQGSLFNSRSALSTHKEEPEDDRSLGLDSTDTPDRSSQFVLRQFTSFKGRHKSLVDLIQEDFPRTPSPVYTSRSCAISHDMVEEIACLDGTINTLHGSPPKVANLSELSMPAGDVQAQMPVPGLRSAGSVLNTDMSAASVCSSSSDLIVGSHPIIKGERSVNGSVLASGTSVPETGAAESEVKNLIISSKEYKMQLPRQHPQQAILPRKGFSSQLQTGQPQIIPKGMHYLCNAADHTSNDQPQLSSVEAQRNMHTTGSVLPLYETASAYGTYYHNLQTSGLLTPQYSIGAYALNASPYPALITGFPPQCAIPMPLDGPASLNFNPRMTSEPTVGNNTPGVDYQNLCKLYGQLGVSIQPSFPDPFYMPYFQQPFADAYAPLGQCDTTVMSGNVIGSLPDNYDPHRGLFPTAYLPAERPLFLSTGGASSPNGIKGGNSNLNYNGSDPHVGLLMRYPTPALSSPVFQGPPLVGTSSLGRRNDSIMLSHSPGRNLGPYSRWQGQKGLENVDDPKYFLLEELKSGKAQRFELFDIAGRIIEFSADQHGSRFIQQKLENCSVEEKASVFEEVLPHASTMMTDVFGNYVIQKFFEHGSPKQRKELASKLAGHILPLSLQMYGCRVIQKALEVIDLDQKTQLVHELDGHVLQCVRDQNGNHVIQKCIECVPTEKIGFVILAFRGQVATLSTHPYGCRVIQRVLEHCTDDIQSQCIVDEILHSACILAQDQYGNYVTQHVLESGKLQERSQIINKLAGKIVQMSQHKFASNVIKKCLEHGNTEERELLIEEIVEQTEGNNNLLVMMKDQFANYVVQKIY